MIHDSIGDGDGDGAGGGGADGDGDATRGFCVIEKNPVGATRRKQELRTQCHSVT